MTENEISYEIVGLAIDVHTIVGPGLLESAYKECMYYELRQSGFYVEKEKPMPLIYQKVHLDCGYRIDLLVEKKVVVEIKSVEKLNNVHLSQMLTYMKLGDYKLGLLINFNVSKLKEGIKRIVNGL
jgi:GxxExxY protein